MALALKDRVKETTIVVGTGTATLLGSSIGFQPFSVVGNGNTTYYCISDQFGSNWEVGIGTYSTSGNTLARTTVLASSNGGALVVFTAGIKDVFVTYPAEKGVWLDASNNAIGLGTPAAFVGTNITGTASGLTAGNVTTNANLTGAVTSTGNATSLGSFTSAQLALAISDETGTGKAVFATNPTLTSPTYAGTLTGSTDVLNIGSGQVYKDASGNVGIGTSSPSSYGKFAVVGSNTGGAIVNYFSNSWTTATANTQVVLSLDPGGNGYGVRDCQIKAINNGSNQSSLAFYTSNATTPVEAMRIDSSGNVGIGTSSPSYKLHVRGSATGALTALQIDNSSTAGIGNQTYLNIFTFDGSQYRGGKIYSSIDGAAWTDARLTLQSQLSGGAYDDTLTLRGGNVGIGTSSPTTKLVVGSIATGTTDSTYKGNIKIEGTETTLESQGGLEFKTTSDGYGAKIQTLSSGGTNLVFATRNNSASWTERMRIDSSGGLILAGSTAQKATGTTWSNPSDIRIKDNITEYAKGLNELMQVSVKEWDYNGKGGTVEGMKGLGVIADEVVLILPNTVDTYKAKLNADDEEDSDIKKFDATEITWLMLKSIQELKAIIDTQQEQINSLLGK